MCESIYLKRVWRSESVLSLVRVEPYLANKASSTLTELLEHLRFSKPGSHFKQLVVSSVLPVAVSAMSIEESHRR
jgi:hypothetical protein